MRREYYTDPYAQPPRRRGVYKAASSFPGLVTYSIIDSSGLVMMSVTIREELVDDALERRFSRFLARHDTGIKLEIVS